MEERLSAGVHGMDLDLPCVPEFQPVKAEASASPKCDMSSTDTASNDQVRPCEHGIRACCRAWHRGILATANKLLHPCGMDSSGLTKVSAGMAHA